ncbi:PEP-CTERM sorting domain-containing protein [Microcoleus sp. Pol10D4]|uniref:PEP-CTERM sorting domain-containing protein n=1 Tax=Microcoleus sp. Pol10D4 TaxID=3055387 RepID=UPI002FD563D7
MGFLVKLFSIKGNVVCMKNLYHKVAVASVCTALGFVLGTSEEAKAATFTLAPSITFEVIDKGYEGYTFDGLGDEVFPGNFDVVVRGTLGEAAEFAEFNIGSLSFAPNTVISSAVFQAEIFSFLVTGLGVEDYTNPGSLGIFGYVGNGTVEASDFEAGVLLSSVDVSSSSPGDILSFDVTPFVNQRVSNGDAFAGFGIRALNFGGLALKNTYAPGIQPRLIVEADIVAEPVPEPTTIFGSALALGLGGWLKRKKSNQQHKTTPQD